MYACDPTSRNPWAPTNRPTTESTNIFAHNQNKQSTQRNQALARLRFDDAVNVSDVEEAIRLTRMSKVID